jgi:hydrogenase expression/formation protein HypD
MRLAEEVFSGELFRFRDRETAELILNRIRQEDLPGRYMHVCGTHQDTLVRFGLEPRLEEVGVEIRQGPGCPVCVTSPGELEEAFSLARAGKTVAVFGDFMRIPGPTGTLFDLRARGEAKVQIVYSVEDAMAFARDHKDREVVYLGIGFETTTPSTAVAIKQAAAEELYNFTVLSLHRLLPPALEAVMSLGEVKLDGLIEPGHVSTIIGTRPYVPLGERHGIPQVVAGFEPLDMLMALWMLTRQRAEGRCEVENQYSRVVKEEGNVKGLMAMEDVFTPRSERWRGFGLITDSALGLSEEYSEFDARRKYEDILENVWNVDYREPPGCRCGEVLRGVIPSSECKLFGTACTPSTPVGPCMVSREGSCAISLKYSSRKVSHGRGE